MRVLIAGGGTGGHLTPGIAIAEEVTTRGGEVLFVGTARGLETKVVPAAGYALELLEVSGLKRMSAADFARGLLRLPPAFARSFGILRRFDPDVVIGVGGYASGPMVMAAALSRRATAIQEQNSVPGITNRVLARVVDRIFVGFQTARFPPAKVVFTGNPVRRRFVQALTAASSSHAGEPQVLVVGGSQGARAVNDLVLSAAGVWARADRMPRLVHQTGPADAERIAAAYQQLGVAADVRPFIEDMPAAYAAAHLVIGRAGALTLAELAMVGRPALLIPLPTAADDHQTKNAQSFADAGAALVLPQATTTGESLAATVTELLGDTARRERMALAMRGQARAEAARAVVEQLEALTAARGRGPRSPAKP